MKHKISQIIFRQKCPALRRDVILTRDTWYGHILGKAGHFEMRGKQDLVRKILRETSDTKEIKTRDIDPHNYCCIQKEVSALPAISI